MSLIVPYSAPPPRPFQWTINSSIQLIRERRNANSQFAQLRNSAHHAVWSSIANNIFMATGGYTKPVPYEMEQPQKRLRKFNKNHER
jgi:hypothetical protein